jgi:hypothetical protein
MEDSEGKMTEVQHDGISDLWRPHTHQVNEDREQGQEECTSSCDNSEETDNNSEASHDDTEAGSPGGSDVTPGNTNPHASNNTSATPVANHESGIQSIPVPTNNPRYNL